ncbi:MAG: 4-hydroxythreonine-4-phosphate dehydrogenase PdxA [Candidatus Delongbacteria bacterium]|nr:4-hydroxythreonine-4-phosphate dehydrogenase PdxA [Candidatus Delongbacteria bacterium]MBN2834917.1 4-hydroxythreonine-4-phosphate dehydrogenase PdxA [Candidatus Delongbacteria bacterium]
MDKIFVSCGDFNGIGPEITLKSIVGSYKDCAIVLIGHEHIYQFYAELSNIDISKYKLIEDVEDIKSSGVFILNVTHLKPHIQPGELTPEAGKLAGLAIVKAVELAKKYNGLMVTAPINKESLHLGGYFYPGHTEFIAELLGNENHLMVLDGEIIRVALVTTHLPLKDVSDNISIDKIVEKGTILYNSLLNDYGIEKPKLAVCSLNPHASDGGLFGDEEEKIIKPAVEKLKAITGGEVLGPLPSDTMFTKNFLKKTDAYLVMYHDQGLIPLKLLTFGEGVNFTAGLSIVRTSPDHGTAYDIAGKNCADYNSMKNAFNMGIKVLRNRNSR